MGASRGGDRVLEKQPVDQGHMRFGLAGRIDPPANVQGAVHFDGELFVFQI